MADVMFWFGVSVGSGGALLFVGMAFVIVASADRRRPVPPEPPWVPKSLLSQWTDEELRGFLDLPHRPPIVTVGDLKH